MFENALNAVRGFVAEAKNTTVQHAPEILIGVGVISVVAGTVLACRATLKVDKVRKEAAEKLDQIAQTVVDEGIDYSESDADSDRKVLLGQVVGSGIKEYAPAAISIAVGVICIIFSHKIMKSRNAAIATAYAGLQAAYTAYRARVIEKEGEEADRYYMYGVVPTQVEKKVTNPETGQEETVLVEDLEDRYGIGEDGYLLGSPYARIFDAKHSTRYEVNDDHNQVNIKFLKMMETEFNKLLQMEHTITLNRVYEALGFEPTPEGQIVGWHVDKDGNSETGDGHITFGILNCFERKDCDGLFEDDGFTRKLILDFNVDGNILKYFGTGLKNDLTTEDCAEIYAQRNK